MIRPPYYIDKHGSLYKVSVERNWNAYIFDCAKRLERADKKGNFVQDIEKTITVIHLLTFEQKFSGWLNWLKRLYKKYFVDYYIPSLLVVCEQRKWDTHVYSIVYELERGNYQAAINECIRYQNSF